MEASAALSCTAASAHNPSFFSLMRCLVALLLIPPVTLLLLPTLLLLSVRLLPALLLKLLRVLSSKPPNLA